MSTAPISPAEPAPKSTMIEKELMEIEKIKKRQAKELEMMLEGEIRLEIIRYLSSLFLESKMINKAALQAQREREAQKERARLQRIADEKRLAEEERQKQRQKREAELMKHRQAEIEK